jgi:predicted ribosome quality control (RQC) complex YloA/Tae2 family protein
MALDGIVIANLVHELNTTLCGGRINKIAQPEADELLLTIKASGSQYRLTISANAGLPLMYLTDTNKPSPLTAPNFCMLLRKHLGGCKIVSITQPGLERIVDFELEHLNELGDLCRKHLIVELMGKHSNIIFCDDKHMILDSIKHVSSMMSSVREVLPGKPYFIPETTDKKNTLDIDLETFSQAVFCKPMNIGKALYSSLTGISPLVSEEICLQASIESDRNAADLNELEQTHLFHIFSHIMEDVRNHDFHPNILYRGSEPVEFTSIELTGYTDCTHEAYSSISAVLQKFYAARSVLSRIRQRSADLRKIVSTAIERNSKKLDILEKQLGDTQKRDKYRIYGELINAYGYNIEPGATSFTALNYYTNEEISIPLDNTLTPAENAVKYFDRYNKLKRTCEATTKLISEVSDELRHLESIQTSLDIALAEEDLVQIKEELVESGYIRRKTGTKKERFTSRPFHYLSSDGFHIYVGKNNLQNDELTFKFADGGDWWFHAKDIPGSHVIVKTEGKELPDRTYEEAARLAGYYSKARGQEKAEIDYTERKNIKKPNAAKPGFVIYHTNYSMIIQPQITGIKPV